MENEYKITLTIKKKDGFIPVAETSKIIEELGGKHKYNALLEVKDGDRQYTINAIMGEDVLEGVNKWLDNKPEILQHTFSMVY